VALRPQPPAPQFFEPPIQPEPLRGAWIGAVAAASGVVALIGGAFKEIAARWRGIVLAHIFFLTLWLAIQVFFFATGAYWCFPSEGPKWVEGLSKYFPQISRCGPTISSHGSLSSPGSLAVSSLGSPTVSSAGSATASFPGSPAASFPGSPAVSSPGSPAVSSLGSPTVSSPGSPTASFLGSPAFPSPGPAAGPSRGAIANCWRDRSLGNNCFARAEPHRKLPPHFRSRGPSAFPCRRSNNCWSDAI
jgi:hypothetical protein